MKTNKLQNKATLHTSIASLFDNLPKLLRPEAVAPLLGLSVSTIYDWRYRCKLRRVPPHLFLKVNRFLYIRTDVLKDWIASQNPSDN